LQPLWLKGDNMHTLEQQRLASEWYDFCATIRTIDGDIHCDDDQTGVVINACCSDLLED
jgi:hypothetical protein